MPLLLTARQTSATDRRLMLRVGQEARVGRSEWVELSLPEDDALALEHFVVRCGSDAVVEVIGDQQTLFINGDGVDRLTLSDRSGGATEFTAGQTVFSVCWTPELAPLASHTAAKRESKSTPPTDDGPRIAAIAQSMKLSDDAVALVNPSDQVMPLVQRIIAAGLMDDVIRFIAGALPPYASVNWAIETGCLIDQSTPPLVDAIARWATSGSESDRLAVRQHLGEGCPGNVAKWIANAIVLSGGSLARDGQPVIVPPQHLTGIAILTAHRWAVAMQPDRVAAMENWIQSGKAALQRYETSTKESADATRSSID